MMLRGSSVALTTDMGGSALVATIALAIAGAVALTNRPERQGLCAQSVITMLIAALGGTGLWIVHPFLAGDAAGTAEPMVILITLLAASGLAAAIASPDPNDGHARQRLIVSACGIVAVGEAAWAVDTDGMRSLNAALGAQQGTLGSFELAQQYSAGLSAVSPTIFAWSAIGALALAIPLAGLRHLPFPRSWLILPLILSPTVFSARMTVEYLTTKISADAPVWYMGVASKSAIGLQLEQSPQGLNVVASGVEPGPRAGDLLTSVNDRAVNDLPTLLRTLMACECSDEFVRCELASGCLVDGAPLQLRANRPSADGGLGQVITVEVPFHYAPE